MEVPQTLEGEVLRHQRRKALHALLSAHWNLRNMSAERLDAMDTKIAQHTVRLLHPQPEKPTDTESGRQREIRQVRQTDPQQGAPRVFLVERVGPVQAGEVDRKLVGRHHSKPAGLLPLRTQPVKYITG